jgi:hypothetical protein
MDKNSPRIELARLANDAVNEVPLMVRELEGAEHEELATNRPWPTRFIAAGLKEAPRRWPRRFISAGGKGAPDRK